MIERHGNDLPSLLLQSELCFLFIPHSWGRFPCRVLKYCPKVKLVQISSTFWPPSCEWKAIWHLFQRFVKRRETGVVVRRQGGCVIVTHFQNQVPSEVKLYYRGTWTRLTVNLKLVQFGTELSEPCTSTSRMREETGASNDKVLMHGWRNQRRSVDASMLKRNHKETDNAVECYLKIFIAV